MGRAEELWEGAVRDGAAFVEALIKGQVVEELYLDYKRSADNGAGSSLSTKDRSTLGKAIAGFGNSAGGLIVWGVDCRPDASGMEVPSRAPIVNTGRFRALLEGATGGVVAPQHTRVLSMALPLDPAKPNGEGYVLTLIPQSDNSPHQVIGEGVYYIRAGSSFCRTPHDVLAGMFGRRPQPKLTPKILFGADFAGDKATFQFGVLVRNDGRGIARDTFANIVVENPGVDCSWGMEQPHNASMWVHTKILGMQVSAMAKADLRMAPGSFQMPLIVNLELKPPFVGELVVKIAVGCDGGPHTDFESRVPPKGLEAFYEHHRRLPAGADRSGGPSILYLGDVVIEHGRIK